MATCSGWCCSITAPSCVKIVASLDAMASREESFIPPKRRHESLPSADSSTTPKPVHSVPQSIPRTRISASLTPEVRVFRCREYCSTEDLPPRPFDSAPSRLDPDCADVLNDAIPDSKRPSDQCVRL